MENLFFGYLFGIMSAPNQNYKPDYSVRETYTPDPYKLVDWVSIDGKNIIVAEYDLEERGGKVFAYDEDGREIQCKWLNQTRDERTYFEFMKDES